MAVEEGAGAAQGAMVVVSLSQVGGCAYVFLDDIVCLGRLEWSLLKKHMILSFYVQKSYVKW